MVFIECKYETRMRKAGRKYNRLVTQCDSFKKTYSHYFVYYSLFERPSFRNQVFLKLQGFCFLLILFFDTTANPTLTQKHTKLIMHKDTLLDDIV